MSNHVKWLRRLAGVFGVLALVAVLAAWIPGVAAAHGGVGGMDGMRGVHPPDSGLASALGIDADKLAAAETKVAEAALAKAVADGKLTQEQADQVNQRGFGGRGLIGMAADHDAALASALGIGVDDLRVARDKAFKTQVDAAVKAGNLTQAQADAMTARHALASYFQAQGVPAKVRAVYEQAAKDAVAAGIVTQEQADEFLSGGRMDMLGGHSGMHGGLRMRGGFRGQRMAPGQPDVTMPVLPSGDTL